MRLIRKYRNRRLYDPGSSSYANLDSLADIVGSGEVLRVEAAGSGEDLTRSVLLQMLQDHPAAEAFPVSLLHRLIRMEPARIADVADHLQRLDSKLAALEDPLGEAAVSVDSPPCGSGEPLSDLRSRLVALESRLREG
jgi:polyhydroxyalkanoate synthesis repressor PhaR